MYKSIIISILWVFSLYASEEAQETAGVVKLSAEQIADAKIEVKEASSVKIPVTILIPAKIGVNEQKHAHIVAKAAGVVKKVLKNRGDLVLENEVLAVLESKEMAEAKAAYLTAIKRQALAAQTLASDEVLKGKISSEQEFRQTALTATEAKINLDVALQQLYILGLEEQQIAQLEQEELSALRTYEIKAPFKGTIIEKDISVGTLINSDQEVYAIADLDTVWLELGIYPQDLPKIKVGNKVLVKAVNDPTQVGEATITQICPIVDDETSRASAVAVLRNSPRIWFPGSYVCANIVVDEAQVPVAVLKEAIQDIDGAKCIFVCHADGFEKREVTTGRSNGTYVEIVSGLEPKSSYAATQVFILKAELGKADAEL